MIVAFVAFCCVLCFAGAGSTHETEVSNILYLIEVVNFSRQDFQNLNLDFSSIKFESDVRSAFEFGFSPVTMEVLAGTPFGTLYFQTGEENLQQYESYRSWLATVPEKPVRVMIAREMISMLSGLRSADGIELSLTPLAVSSESIMNALRLATVAGTMSVDSVVSLKAGEPFPVAMIRKSKRADSNLPRLLHASEERYAVLYISAFESHDFPEETLLDSSSIDGLLESLWKVEEKELVSNASLGISYSEGLSLSFNANLWLIESLRFRAGYSNLISSRLEFGVTLYPSKWSLGLDGEINYLPGSGGTVSLGLSDEEAVLEDLTIGAAIYPISFDFITAKTVSPLFRVYANYSPGIFNFYTSYSKSSRFDQLQVSLGIRPFDWLLLSGKYTKDFSNMGTGAFSVITTVSFR